MIRNIAFALAIIFLGIGAAVAGCPPNSHIKPGTEHNRNVICNCNEGFQNIGGVCQSTGVGIISDQEKLQLKDAPAPKWAAAKTRNDCKRLFVYYSKTDLKLGPRLGLRVAMEHVSNAYKDCLKGKQSEEAGVTDCGFSGLFDRCKLRYERNKDAGEEKAEVAFFGCYQPAMPSGPGVCFH